MKFVGAYQTPCPVTLPKVDTSTTTPPANKTYVPNMCEGGIASVAQFSDPSGNMAYMDIPNSQYEAMTGLNGYQHNPTEHDFDASLQAFIASTTAAAESQSSTSTAPTSPSTSDNASDGTSTPPNSSSAPGMLPGISSTTASRKSSQ